MSAFIMSQLVNNVIYRTATTDMTKLPHHHYHHYQNTAGDKQTINVTNRQGVGHGGTTVLTGQRSEIRRLVADTSLSVPSVSFSLTKRTSHTSNVIQ